MMSIIWERFKPSSLILSIVAKSNFSCAKSAVEKLNRHLYFGFGLKKFKLSVIMFVVI